MISFVYFDLGGVVVLDFSKTNKWKQLKKELSIPLERYKEFDDFFNQYGGEVCVGRGTESLLPLIKEKFGVRIPESYSFLVDGFVKRFDKNPSILPVIENISAKGRRVGLLTNAYPNMLKEIQKRKIIPNILWDVIIDSSVVKLAKPDPAIYELSEKKAGVKGGQILFVENSQGHIEAAKKFGWQTFLYDPSSPQKSSLELEKAISITWKV
jgi:HAD superfamily hydrolase (TIGR01509 family)